MKILRKKDQERICDTLIVANQILAGTDYNNAIEWARAVANVIRGNNLVLSMVSEGVFAEYCGKKSRESEGEK